jgi:hypothetical protein
MEGLNHCSPSLWGRGQEIFRALGPQIVLIHHRQVPEEKQLIIRFANGYGVALSPVSPPEDEPLWEMLVLRFHGPKIKDGKLAQYTPVPEFNRGDFDEIMNLCGQVSLLPQNRTLTLCPGQSETRIKKGELEKRCSNFC